MSVYLCIEKIEEEKPTLNIHPVAGKLAMLKAVDPSPLDMPPGRFVTACQACQLCRNGEADPNAFGMFEMHGLDFIQGNVVRDFLALNKDEILPWDWGWGYLTEACFADLAFFDHLAARLTAGDKAFTELQELYLHNPSSHSRF
jgi:hypothetical protein